MASLQIKKNTDGYFTFILDGDVNGAIIDNAPNLTSFDNGNLCHFKTANGASLFKNQNISYADVTYTDISATNFTFANIGQLWQKLITEEFFKGLNQGSGSGATRFDALLDTFTYHSNNGKVPVVDASQLKLVPVTFYNYNQFIQMDDVAISELVANKILSVELVGGNPRIVLSDKPDTTQQLVNAMGYLDYDDAGTTTTPLTLVANVNKKLTNDTLGTFTDTSQRPFGVPSIWNTDNNQFDFKYLTIGDTIDIRVDISVTTTSVNQNVKIFLRLAIGSPSQYDLPISEISFKAVGTYQIVRYTGIYLGSSNFINYPAELYVVTDSGGTCVVNGWYTRIFRKSVNLVNFTIDEDLTADHYRGTWDASTNTPTLTNGFGQVGDYYKVSVAGSGYSIGDIVGYDGMVYYKKVNNNTNDVLEFADFASFPATGESGKIYIDLATNLQYRWSGSAYVQIGGGSTEEIWETSRYANWRILKAEALGGNQSAITFTNSLSFINTGTATNKTSTYNTGNFIDTIRRIGLTSAATAGAEAQRRIISGVPCSTKSGFYFCADTISEDAATVATAADFIGLGESFAAPFGNAEPSITTTCVLLAYDSTDSNMQIMHNDNAGTCTKIDLGVNFPARTNATDLYRLELYCATNGTEINYRVTRLNTGDQAIGTLTTNIPTSARHLTLGFWRGNRSTALAVTKSFSQITIATPC